MSDVPTVVSSKTIGRFLEVIITSGIPSKVDTKYLRTVGFKSGNDTSLISAFKLLGFIDSSQAPTELWRLYKDKSKSAKLLGNAVKNAYSDLFALYPDANRKDDEAIRNWIRSTTGSSEATVTRALATFKALVAKAEFDGVEATNIPDQSPGGPATVKQPAVAQVVQPTGRLNPAVNINIELQVPATNDPKVYENFFAAMKKHLLEDDDKS